MKNKVRTALTTIALIVAFTLPTMSGEIGTPGAAPSPTPPPSESTTASTSTAASSESTQAENLVRLIAQILSLLPGI